MSKSLKEAWHEAMANILIANCVSVPLNYMILSILLPLQWTVMSITVVTTLLFTIVALIRFITIRIWFAQRQQA